MEEAQALPERRGRSIFSFTTTQTAGGPELKKRENIVNQSKLGQDKVVMRSRMRIMVVLVSIYSSFTE